MSRCTSSHEQPQIESCGWLRRRSRQASWRSAAGKGASPRSVLSAAAVSIESSRRSAREEEGAEAEAGGDLRQLGRMAEAVGQVGDAARLDAEAATDAPSEQEVADERLAADEDLVGQDVRRPRLEPSRRQQRAQP